MDGKSQRQRWEVDCLPDLYRFGGIHIQTAIRSLMEVGR